MDIYAHLESHYNFLILNIPIFFSASCQFSALWPRKQGFWQVRNCYSHFGCQWDVLRIWKQAQVPILKIIKKQTKTIHLYMKPVDRYPDSRIRFKSQLLHWFQDAIWGKVLNISEPLLHGREQEELFPGAIKTIWKWRWRQSTSHNVRHRGNVDIQWWSSAQSPGVRGYVSGRLEHEYIAHYYRLTHSICPK